MSADTFIVLSWEASQSGACEKMEKAASKVPSLSKVGSREWNSRQGFYVYRNRRMLVAGDWLGLPFTKEEHYKLARIQVDIPNAMDQDWQIDVRKSRVRPPGVLRKDLERIANLTRKRAVEIYRHRGKIVARSRSAGHTFAWQRKVKNGTIFYCLDRKHPLISKACS